MLCCTSRYVQFCSVHDGHLEDSNHLGVVANCMHPVILAHFIMIWRNISSHEILFCHEHESFFLSECAVSAVFIIAYPTALQLPMMPTSMPYLELQLGRTTLPKLTHQATKALEVIHCGWRYVVDM